MRFLFTLLAVAVSIFMIAQPANAMPEYAVRVGEPCASCHFSPAGGGLRNVRGQAWVASDKPSTVLSTEEALKVLGVQLPSDMSIYTAVPSAIPTPAPFRVQPDGFFPLLERLTMYEGN